MFELSKSPSNEQSNCFHYSHQKIEDKPKILKSQGLLSTYLRSGCNSSISLIPSLIHQNLENTDASLEHLLSQRMLQSLSLAYLNLDPSYFS